MAPSPAPGATRDDGPTRRASQRTAPMPAEINTNKLDLFKKARSKIESIDKAIAFLEKYQLIVPGAAPSHNALVTGLLHFATSGPGGALATEGLVAFAYYADAIQHEEVSTNLVEATMRKLQPLWTSLELTREDLEAQATSTHELVAKIQETVAQTEECCKTAASVGASRAATSSHPHTGESPTTARPLTYAAAVQHTLPTTHASAIDREEVRARQILIDGTGLVSEDGTRLTETVLVAKAEAALQMMRDEGMEVPDTPKFASASCLRNGGVIYEVTKADDAHWLRKDAAQKAFLDNFGGQAVIKSRAYNVIVEYLPISFNPADAAHLEDAERFSDLDPGTIKQARWIKPPGRRNRNQRYAHALLTLGNADTANTVIRRGMVIHGKKVSARKSLPEPRRCLKCQRYGTTHMAAQCKSIHETCGTCAKIDHTTAQCPETDPVNFRCCNCISSGHAAWDRDCPVFVEHRKKLLTRQPDSTYRFFPTTDPSTWEQINEDTPCAQRPNPTTRSYPTLDEYMPHDYDDEGYRQVMRNKGKGPQRQSALQQSTLPFTAADNPQSDPQPGPSRPRAWSYDQYPGSPPPFPTSPYA